MKTVTRGGAGTRFAALLMAVMLMFGVCGMVNLGVGGMTAGPVAVAKADDTTPDSNNAISHVIDRALKDSVGDSTRDSGYTVADGTTGLSQENNTQVGGLLNKGQVMAQVIMGGATIIAIVFLVINIARLATSGSNDQARKKAQTGILWSFIALAAFGGLTAVVSFAWNFLTGIG